MGGNQAVRWASTRARSWRLAAATVAAVVLAAPLLGACGGDDDRRLNALLADPLADAELPGATSSTTSTSRGSTGPGITSPAMVRRTFTVPSGTVDDAIDRLADQARANGWTLEPRPVLGFNGEKAVGGYFTQAVIAGIDAENSVWVEIYTRDD